MTLLQQHACSCSKPSRQPPGKHWEPLDVPEDEFTQDLTTELDTANVIGATDFWQKGLLATAIVTLNALKGDTSQCIKYKPGEGYLSTKWLGDVAFSELIEKRGLVSMQEKARDSKIEAYLSWILALSPGTPHPDKETLVGGGVNLVWSSDERSLELYFPLDKDKNIYMAKFDENDEAVTIDNPTFEQVADEIPWVYEDIGAV